MATGYRTPRRAGHVAAAVAAFDDLRDVLRMPRHAIALGGTLGLSFGARGSDRFAAHYEPTHRVVNLTRTHGAGSLAHEWLHALDHALSGTDDLPAHGVILPRWRRRCAPSPAASDVALAVLDPTLARFAHAVLVSPVHERTRRADRFRSGAYHSRPEELLARGFEAAVVATLASEGRRNDYLANIREDTADGEPLEYPVRLSRTPCHFGGTRTWLHCPAAGCGRRVRVLYGGRLFVCRQCARLAYPSTREDRTDLAARRGDRIRRRLSWSEGMFNLEGGRPKGMHRRTCEDLVDEHQRHRMAFLRGVDAKFGLGVFDN